MLKSSAHLTTVFEGQVTLMNLETWSESYFQRHSLIANIKKWCLMPTSRVNAGLGSVIATPTPNTYSSLSEFMFCIIKMFLASSCAFLIASWTACGSPLLW